MKSMPFLMHALSPLHAGTGQAVDIIDLPIARMRSTGIPLVPGSSIKGVLRDARGNGEENGTGEEVNTSSVLSQDELFAVFGPDVRQSSEHAGALLVGDARLLALPVRSFKGTFAWTTSPLLLALAQRDIGKIAPSQLPQLEGRAAAVGQSINVHHNKIYLEDLDLPVKTKDEAVRAWGQFLAPFVGLGDDRAMFYKRLVVVDDETMTFLWETSTQVDARIRLDPQTRTVSRGALWYEESLPAESLLCGLLQAHRSMRSSVEANAAQILQHALPREEILQFGGKATVGRGRCRIVPLVAEDKTSSAAGGAQ